MCELETARGCSHGATGGCSFCTEPFYGRPRYRTVAGVAAEVAALSRHGARHFRVGPQPDILAYGAGKGDTRRHGRNLLEKLFSAIRASAPAFKNAPHRQHEPGHHCPARGEEPGSTCRYLPASHARRCRRVRDGNRRSGCDCGKQPQGAAGRGFPGHRDSKRSRGGRGRTGFPNCCPASTLSAGLRARPRRPTTKTSSSLPACLQPGSWSGASTSGR